MTTNPQHEPSFIDVDLDQWRREISTFAAATNNALDAIVEELSSVVGVKAEAGKAPPKLRMAPRAKSTELLKQRIKDTKKQSSADGSQLPEVTGTNREQRLESIKLKLASRMSKQN